MSSHDHQAQFAQDLDKVLAQVRELLVSKNRKYGDAALNPKQTFSTCSAIELINVRMDDKLSRIRNRQNDEDEDPEFDLLGYLLIKQIAKGRELVQNPLSRGAIIVQAREDVALAQRGK